MITIKQDKDIILILPPKRLKEHRYSLGLMYISGYLRDHGFDNLIIDGKILADRGYQYDNKEKAKGEIIKAVLELRPQVLGFTATTMEIAEVTEMNQTIKKQINVFSMIGGPQATADPASVIQSGFDAAIIGEGEATALELMQELQKEQPDLSRIRGIAWLNQNGDVVVNERREYLDLADFSLPAYDKVNMEYYTRIWDDIIRGIPMKAVMVMASRGCPYGCTFCACNQVFGRHVRYRNLDNIKKEIYLLKNEYGVEGIWFADDTLTANYDHVRKICQIMKDSGLYWGAQSRIDLVNEDIVKLMAESGCLQLDFGVESGSQRVLDEIIDKKIKLPDVEKALELCRKYGIRREAGFMIGLPGETKAEMQQTFEFAKQIKADHYSFSIFTALPGTKLFNDFFRDHIKTSDYDNFSFFQSQDKFNRSGVSDSQELGKLFDFWRQGIFEGVKKRGVAHFLKLAVIWLKLGHKAERLDFILFKVKRAAGYYFGKILKKISKRFYFEGARRPDFKNIVRQMDYDGYWRERGFKTRSKLMEREGVFMDWIKSGSHVLDLGCGNSRLPYELKNSKKCQVSGLDVSDLVIDGLKQSGIDGIRANIEDKDFRLVGQYDYIVISEVLEHIKYPEDLIDKIKNNAQYLAISIPNSAFYRYRLGLMFTGRFFTQWMTHPAEHIRYWSHKDFLDWLEAVGLEVLEFKSSNGFYFKDIWPNMFGHQICYLARIKK
ncbi:MAG: radical SAM protein [Candidatus Buchananbacteria bacterium]|jgi:methionine biosynthesis protein MetW